MADVALRPIDRTEFPAYFRTLIETFGEDPRDSDREADFSVFEPERSLAGFDGDRLVATAGVYSRDMTLPGGPRPVAAVSMISVAPTHRRRGVLTEMMRRQLIELHEDRREPVAVLWAADAGIYGRFGYGLAANRATLAATSADLTMRPDIDLGTSQIRLTTPEQARPAMVGLYEQVRGHRVGWLDRRGSWWDFRLRDAEHLRGGSTTFRYALNTEEDGRVTGYAVYRIKQSSDVRRVDSEVLIAEVVALTPQAYAAVWAFLSNLDLVNQVRKRIAQPDEPLRHLMVNPRAVQLELLDSLWVRLVDLRRALTGRPYAAGLDVVFEVTDEFCPWNAGRWRLVGGPDGAECVRTGDAADLALSAGELGAAYLGGTRLATLAAAGRVAELRPGALARASIAFGIDHEPWCPEIF